MDLADVKARLAHIVGIENLTVEETPRGDEVYRLGDVTAKVPIGTDRQSMIYLAGKLANPFEENEKPTMSITGLKSGAFEAKLAEMRQKVADSQAQALATIDGAVTEGAAKMDAAAESVKAKVYKEIEDALQEFAPVTNGGPA